MAYNLQSLITILEKTLNPQQTQWIVDDNKPQLQSLLEKSVSLQQIFEETSLSNIEWLESEIRDAAHRAEDMIESHMLDRMLDHYNTQAKSLLGKMVYRLQQICNPKAELSITCSTPELQQVMHELDSVMEQVMKLIKEKATSSCGSSISHDTSSKSVVDEGDQVQSKAVVGLDEDLMQLMDRVIGMQSKLEIVPIVGMGGIGKTTLAHKLYQDPAIVKHFTSLAWTTVSQDYDMQAILLSLLRCIIGEECNKHAKTGSDELKDILYRSLYGRRYIIVLDDIWSIRFWDEIRMYLPDNNKGSRIVITTREIQVAEHANSHSKQHKMQLLNKSDSWNLLHQVVFRDEQDCPAEIERIGKSIARNCGGLPLAICVIGGLLSKANMSKDVWEKVANDVTAAAGSDGQFFDILSLSYNHMPSSLRPCFLYMAAFPEDHKVKASKLIRLWVAEGFLKSRGDKSLEEEAEDCLKALVDRNLVFVRTLKRNGRANSYGMHDLMRDLCLKKAEEQRFVHVGKKQGGEVEGIRRVSIHPSLRNINLFYASESMPLARSFLSTVRRRTRCIFPSDVLSALRLLRVLDLLNIWFQKFPTEVLEILNLRYLAFSANRMHDVSHVDEEKLPSGISRLCNLQTLVISSFLGFNFDLPCEILQMTELRHVLVYGGTFSFYTDDGSDLDGFILDKLQTFVSVNSSHEFLQRIPNVKKLGIHGGSSTTFDLNYLHKLETLGISGIYYFPLISRSTLRLPPSLKKLSLERCEIVGEVMNYLSELPNLEILKLQRCEFKDEWDATEREFCRLKFLLLESVELVKWEADETNFPRLRHLVIRQCLDLEEIPSGIGEIPTLQTIQLYGECRPSLVASAKLIIEEQRDNGNDDLQLRM